MKETHQKFDDCFYPKIVMVWNTTWKNVKFSAYSAALGIYVCLYISVAFINFKRQHVCGSNLNQPQMNVWSSGWFAFKVCSSERQYSAVNITDFLLLIIFTSHYLPFPFSLPTCYVCPWPKYFWQNWWHNF